MTIKQYYVTNPTAFGCQVGDTWVLPYAEKVLVNATADVVDSYQNSGWTVNLRNEDQELGTLGVGNAGKGAFPIQSVGITRADYDALVSPDPGTAYFIVDE